ncbi:MAG: OmpA family protein [Polyangiaceae bacterium]
MRRAAFAVPGEELGVWAPATLLSCGALGAVVVAVLLGSPAVPAEASSMSRATPGAEGAAATVSTDAIRPPTAPSIAPPPPAPSAIAAPPGPSGSGGAIPQCPPVRVGFQSNAFGPSPAAITELDRLAAWLREHSDTTLVVSGHADAVGTEDGNLRLSHIRAESIARELSARGVARSRMTVRGYGAYQPLEGVLEDAADNRRVVIYVRGDCLRGFEEVIGP